jgi:hypothetical protein
VFAGRSHFPQLALNVPNVRFADTFEPDIRDAIDDPSQRRPQLERLCIDLSGDSIVQNLNGSYRHLYHL